MKLVRSLWTLVQRAFGRGSPPIAAAQTTPLAAEAPTATAVAVRFGGNDDRPLITSLAAQAPLMAGLARRVEPPDFMLAARLASVARLNPPAGRKTGPTEMDRAVHSSGNRPAKVAVGAKTVRPGCLSPIAARGSAAPWRPRTAPAGLQRAA